MKKSKPKPMKLDCGNCMFVCGDTPHCGVMNPPVPLRRYPVRPDFCPFRDDRQNRIKAR